MSEYLIFPAIILCISPSLHFCASNASCRARSWLIRASVANASSPSLTAEMNGDQMRSRYEVGCCVIGDKEEERERWKWGEGGWNKMNIYSGMYLLLKVLWFPGGLRKHFNSWHQVFLPVMWEEPLSASLFLLAWSSHCAHDADIQLLSCMSFK